MKKIILILILMLSSTLAYSQWREYHIGSTTTYQYVGYTSSYNGGGADLVNKKFKKIDKKIKENKKLSKREQEFFDTWKSKFWSEPKELSPKKKALEEYNALVRENNVYTNDFNEHRISFDEYMEKTKPLKEKMEKLYQIATSNEDIDARTKSLSRLCKTEVVFVKK